MPSGGYNRGKGDLLAWLKDHAGHDGEECLIWPFSCNHQGYGHLGYYGKVRKAHRIMCMLAHGEPPTSRHQAAHSCGNGNKGCVHPGHLSWKTPRENRLEANQHGTGNKLAPRHLTIDQVEEIRASEQSYLTLASQYGVYFGTIAKIKRGETWKAPRSVLTWDQVKRIKELDAEGLSHSEIARMTGASYSAVRWTRIRQSYRGA